MTKMHQNTFGGQAPPGRTGELERSPRSPSHNHGVLLLMVLKKSLFANLPHPLIFDARSALASRYAIGRVVNIAVLVSVTISH